MLRRSALIATIQIALATSAVAGVASVFMRQGSMAGRTAGTALVVLLGSLCLLPLSRPSTDGRTSPLEILWGGFVCIGAALTMAVIWSLAPAGAARDLLFTTTLAWIGYGVPTSLVLLPALRRRATPSAITYPASSRTSVLGAGICFLAAVVVQVSMEQSGNRHADFVPMAFVVSILSVVLAAANLVSFRVPRPRDRSGTVDRLAASLGVLATLGAWIAWMLIALVNTKVIDPAELFAAPVDRDELLQRCLTLATCTTGLSISGALWCALRAVRFRGWAATLPPVTATLTLALSALLTVAALRGALPDFAMRITVALAIVDASALLTVVLVLRARRSSPDTEDFVRPIEGLPMKCPRCAAPRVAPLGESACASCGLVLLLSVRDDRCPACRYDLRGQAEGPCPECGRIRQTPGSASTPVATS